jgi:hypothetical protein
MNETLQAYLTSLGDVIAHHNAAFRLEHPEVGGIDMILVAAITVNQQEVLGSICSIDSVAGQVNRNALDVRRSVALCNLFTGACAS